MYAAAPMPNTPAVPPLYVPGGVDHYGFYALSTATVMAPDALPPHSSGVSPSPPPNPAAPTLDEEMHYWEESFRTYLGLCTVADQLAALEAHTAGLDGMAAAASTQDSLGTRPAALSATLCGEKDDPLCSHSPLTTPGGGTSPHDRAVVPPPPLSFRLTTPPLTSRLRLPVTGVLDAVEAASPATSTRTSDVTFTGTTSSDVVALPSVVNTRPTEVDSSADAQSSQTVARVSPLALTAALDAVERDWESRLCRPSTCAHGELRRLLWAFWSGAAHRTAEVQAMADTLYAALAAEDDDAVAAATAPSVPSTLLAGPRTGFHVAPLGHEEAETISRDLSRTFPTHCLFTASAAAPAPPHLTDRPTFLFSPNAKAAAERRQASRAARVGAPPPPTCAPPRPSTGETTVTATTTLPAASSSFSSLTLAVGQAELGRLLRAYSRLDPEVGYCQGMSFVAAVLLLHAPEAEAFQIFYCLLQNPVHSLRDLYTPHFGFLHTLMQTLDRQVRQLLPVLHRHLQQEGVLVEYFAASWFLTLFVTQLPLGVVVHLWDWFLLRGWSVMLQAAIAVLQWRQDELLVMDMEAILLTLKGLKAAAYPAGPAPHQPRASLFASSTTPTSHAAGPETHADPLAAVSVSALERASPASSAATIGSARTSLPSPPLRAHSRVSTPAGAAGDEAAEDWLAYMNEPAVPAQPPAAHERAATSEDVVETLRRILEVPIDMDDIPTPW